MDGLLAQYRQAHAENLDWWAGLSVWPQIERIRTLIQTTGSASLLDYGCGKGMQYAKPVIFEDKSWPTLGEYWGVEPDKFDPCVPQYANFNKLKNRYDGVICTDVLEHTAHAHDARNLIGALFGFANKFVFAAVSCQPARKFLPDGRNAHTLVRTPEWWAGVFETVAREGVTWKLACEDGHTVKIFTGGAEFGASAAAVVNLNDGKTRKLVVQTKNCVPHPEIINNIRHTESLGLPIVEICHPHDKTVLLVSGGPSWTGYLEEIRTRQAAGDIVVCVKSSHDYLIRAGVIPWGCSLLDPRALVVDFIENPHPEVRYFVATMVHPETIQRLTTRGARLWTYHAAVGAGEEHVAKRGVIIGGGSCAATRGISILRTLGFRKFDLYGFDSCYSDDPVAIENYVSAHKDENRMKVEVFGKSFLTDPQLVAQCQDMEGFFKQMPDIEWAVHGPGMVAHIYENLMRSRLESVAKLKTLEALVA